MRLKALKARLGREANFPEREAMVPRKLARANRETSLYRIKREVTTCLKSKEKPVYNFLCEAIAEPSERCETSKICTSREIFDTHEKREYKLFSKPACYFPREAVAEPSEKCEASKICTSRRISDTREKREYKNSLKPACDFSCEAIAEPACDFPCETDTEPSKKSEASNTCEKRKTSYTRKRRENKNSLQSAYDSPREINTEPSNNSEASNICMKCKILRENHKDDWQIVVNRKNR